MEDPKVAVLIAAKNEEKYIEKTLSALFDQSLKPWKIVVVDDGSKDRTVELLSRIRKMHPELVIIRRKDRGFSALGLPFMAFTYNSGIAYLLRQEFDYLLIIGADTILPENYIRDLVDEFEKDSNLGLASGIDDREEISTLHVRGSGRMMRAELLKKMGLLPPIYGWETFQIVFAFSQGYKVKHFPQIKFYLARPSGKGHARNYYGWGRAMRELGYHPFYALGRIIMNVVRGHPKRAYFLLRGYLAGGLNHAKLHEVRAFWRKYQSSYLARLPFLLIR